MMEEESTRNIHSDLEPRDVIDSETDSSHVVLRQNSAAECEEVKFPFNGITDSLALLSVYRYAKSIREFLGWENCKVDSDAEENSHSEILSPDEKPCCNDSQKEEIILSAEQTENSCGKKSENNVSQNLSVNVKIPLTADQIKDTNLPCERDINNYKDKYKEKESEEKHSNIFDNNITNYKRNSCHFNINEFSDHYLEKKNDTFTDLRHLDENDIRTSILTKDFENKSPAIIFRTEFNLNIEKAELNLNSHLDNCISNNNKNTDMDEILIGENEKANDGLQLNDENSIILDEKQPNLEKNENESNGKYLKESIPQDVESYPNKIKCNSMENNDQSEQNTRNNFSNDKNGLETTNNIYDDNVPNETKQKEINSEKYQELSKLQNGNFHNKENGLELTSTLGDNCKNLSKTSSKEKNAFNSTISTPIKAKIVSKNEKNKESFSKIPKSFEKQKEEEEYDKETICGMGFFKPQWIQRYATVKTYVILYSLIGILHGSYYAYLIGTLSSLEKRFAFKSKISGTIMIADEVIPLFFGMIIGYYSSKAHRPRIVAFSMLLSAGCCFITSLPYFIYGPIKSLMISDIKSNTGTKYCNASIGSESCDPDRPQNLLAVMFLIFGSFLKGFGNLGYYAIGLAYLDDNSDKKSTPIYLAITLALRLLGPLVGFLMSSGFLKYYENPFYDPGFGPDDPRWIGAWWIGFFLQGVLLVIFTIPIALFPRRLPGQKKVEKVVAVSEENGLKEIFTGLVSALKRLGKNPVFVVLIINTTMKVFGHFGHSIMLPKYMENQFRLSASQASLYSGAVSIVCIIISTILGGFLIWRFRPRIKVLLGGMIVSEIILCVGFLLLMIPRCQPSEMLHFGMDEDGLILNSVCNRNCDCSTSAFTPFCGADGKTLYFSPCYAGCTEEMPSSLSNKVNKKFGNCSCVDQQQVEATISEGFCPDENCHGQMIAYLIILFILVTVSNLFTVAATMILLRSVHPSDKSVALGTFETFICLFGFIPFPVTYGALVDSACLVWEKSCGETGNCWFYDMDKYDYLLHGVSSLFSALSVVCLILLYFLSSRVRNLYVEEDEVEEETKYVDIKLDTVSGSVTKL